MHLALGSLPPYSRSCVAGCLLAWLGVVWSANEASVQPGTNEHYLKPDMVVDDWVQRFERERREVYAHRDAIADAVGIETGMAVADVGAGTGLFVPLFAARVGSEGHVYAVDIVPQFAAHVRDRVAEAGLKQVSVVLSAERSITLPANSVDVVFLCNVYHHIEYPANVFASIRTALRPHGRLVIIDFERIPGTTKKWILSHVRVGSASLIKEIEAMGFGLEETLAIEGLEDNYMLRFTAR